MCPMVRLISIRVGLLALSAVAIVTAQELPQSEWFEGFTKAEPEHMVIYEKDGVCLKRFQGRAQFLGDGPKSGREGVLIELKRNRVDEHIRLWRTSTNSKGRFRIRGLQKGQYIMKATLNGFQSIYRRVELSAQCPSKQGLVVELQLGL